MIRVEPSENCYFGTCSLCLGATSLMDEMKIIFENECIDEITFRQWTNVDRTTLQIIIFPVDEFLEKLLIGLEKLFLHLFLVRKQNEFIDNKKKSLEKMSALLSAIFPKIMRLFFKILCKACIETTIRQQCTHSRSITE